MRKLVALACFSLAAASAVASFSAAAFTTAASAGGNGLTVDRLANYFSVTPGSAVQPGTATPVASGNVDSLNVDFGTVPSARTFTNVFRITNVSGSTQTAVLSVSSVPQISSAFFASSGSATATLAAGGSTTLSVTTSSTVAGRGTGTMRLRLSSSTWMYRDYALHVDEAPEVPGPPTALPKLAGRIDLAWAASSTTTNLAGYNLYRSGGAGYTKLNAAPLTALTYSDTATVDGTTYTYKVRAVSSGTPVLESVDSTTVTAVADATSPGRPSAIALANGGGAGGAYVNAANRSAVGVSVTLPAGSLSSDTVTVTVSNGASSVTGTGWASAGPGTVTIGALNLSGLADGTLTITATSTDFAGNISSVYSATFTKDTVAPGAPTAFYFDQASAPDRVGGAAETGSTVNVTKTAPLPTASFSTTAASGFYVLNVATVNGNNPPAIPVTYAITATDVAGNTSATTTLNANDTR
jgi:hypothetical protein